MILGLMVRVEGRYSSWQSFVAAVLRLEWTFGRELTVLMIVDDCLYQAAVTSSTNTNGTHFESATGTRHVVVIDGWEMHVPYVGHSARPATFLLLVFLGVVQNRSSNFIQPFPAPKRCWRKSNMSHQDHWTMRSDSTKYSTSSAQISPL